METRGERNKGESSRLGDLVEKKEQKGSTKRGEKKNWNREKDVKEIEHADMSENSRRNRKWLRG